MKWALSQLNPILGDVSGNLTRILADVKKARSDGASLILFPELSLTGYPPMDLIDSPSLADACLSAFEPLSKQSQGIVIVVGFVEKNESGLGRPFYNSLAVFKDGKHHYTYRKQLLPYYDVFDDPRFFEPGTAVGVIEVGGKRVGLTICEDVWNFAVHGIRPYSVQPLTALKKANVDFLLNASASPFHLGKPALRVEVMRTAARYLGCPVLLSNQVGGQDDLIFDGGSLAVRADGTLATVAGVFKEDLNYVDTEVLAGGDDVAVNWPESDPAWLDAALTLGLRDYAHKTGIRSVCLGLSGGIDSSVAAVIAVRALGAESVLGVALPSHFNLPASFEDAEVLARRLGISFLSVAIETGYEWATSELEKVLGRKLKPTTCENIQPRLRMALLMALANEGNQLLLNTSNKSELAVGYSTLYGDSAGGICVLGDLTKGQVYQLAGFYNQQGELIPKRVVTRAPSAELRENQTDQDTLPEYPVLDGYIRQWVERSTQAQDSQSVSRSKDERQFLSMYKASEFKRHQCPPILRVSQKAFGRGRRIPIAHR